MSGVSFFTPKINLEVVLNLFYICDITIKKHTIMSNQVRIICTVPTRHQIYTISSLSRGNYGHNPDGSLVWDEEFPTVDDAKDCLRQRAYQLAYDCHELREMENEISTYGSITFDEVTARIETI